MNKKTLLGFCILLFLICIPLVSASSVNPTSPTYLPEQKYDFILDLQELNDTIWFKLSKGELIILPKSQVDYDEDKGSYLVNIDDLSAGEYDYLWQKENETNITNISGTYAIEKALPEFDLLLNEFEENLEVNKNSSVDIEGVLKTPQGTLELLVDGVVMNSTSNNNASNDSTSNESVTFSKLFDEPGHYVITARYNETENYSSREKNLEVNVTENFVVELSNDSFGLEDDGFFLIHADEGSVVDVELLLRSENNPSFETLEYSDEFVLKSFDIRKDGLYWKKVDLNHTLKAGNYTFIFTLNDGVEKILNYEVINTLNLEIEGEDEFEVGETSKFDASASGGISPYTFSWSFNGNVETGNELELSYSSPKTKTITLIVTDFEGNKKTEEFTVTVNEYFDLVIEVRDYDNKVLSDAEVEIVDLKKSELTDSSGKAKFRLVEDDYKLAVYDNDHSLRTENIALDKDTSVTIKLNKLEVSSKSSASSNISLTKPNDGASLNSNDVEFEAEVSLSNPKTCKLLIADKGGSWFLEFAKKENVKEESLSFNEKLDDGEYSWKISCDSEDSEIRELKISSPAFSTTSITDSVDAGELRRQIESANDNLKNLDLAAKRAADALDMTEVLRVSLRDYERILRDINSLALRRDLTDTQKQDKIQEYKDQIKELEKKTPLLLELQDSEEFIAYPNQEELENISNEYLENRNLQGRLDKREVESLQNLIRVRTFSALLTITYLDGSKKDITLVHKDIEYTGDTTRNQFILESVPKSLGDDLEVMQTHDSIIKNKLLSFDKPASITYFVLGHSSLDIVKDAHTILLSERAFVSGSSGAALPIFTGMVTMSRGDIDHTAGLILLLVILVLAYLFYAFDLKDKLLNYIGNFYGDKKLSELRMLVNDAKDYLETQNLKRANLIYKEIKMLYETSPRQIKNNIYDDISELVKILNEKYLEYLITKTRDLQKSGNNDESIKAYNKLIDVFNKSEEDTKKSFKDQILELNTIIEKNKK